MKRNHTGHRVGEHHHRAKLSDAQVAEMRAIRQRHGTSYANLAAIFNCGESTARDIVKHWTRQ